MSPSIGFKPEFVKKILSGEKRSTIRNKRFKMGDVLYMFTGLRTRNCKRFGTATVEKTSDVSIFPDEQEIYVKGEGMLSLEEIVELGETDGFDTTLEFFNFFKDTYPDEYKKDRVIRKQLVVWKDFRKHRGPAKS